MGPLFVSQNSLGLIWILIAQRITWINLMANVKTVSQNIPQNVPFCGQKSVGLKTTHEVRFPPLLIR